MHRPYLWLSALLASASPSATWAQQSGQYSGPHMWNGGFFGPIMMIVIVAVVAVVVVLLVPWLSGQRHEDMPRQHPGKTPLDILKERYARGEIDKEEFEERRKILGD